MMTSRTAPTGLSECHQRLALLRLLPVSDRDKDVEVLALRHQINVLERQLGTTRPRFSPSDRAFLAALLHRLPIGALLLWRLVIRPATVLRWHRDLVRAENCIHAVQLHGDAHG